MDDVTRNRIDRERDLSNKPFHSACFAPFVSMYFQTLGDVLACCRNTEQILGNVTESDLIEIWNGPRAQQLRSSLKDYDVSGGCSYCSWQFTEGGFSSALASAYEDYPLDARTLEWPQVMEFSLSNTCNLECLMCNGDQSSKIRSRREGRAPLPKVYGDRFFEQIEPFLPHLTTVRFYGGEPFLASESLRVMELLARSNPSVECIVTTNGTHWNERIESILDRLSVSVNISLDGCTRGTVERIRAGASYDDLMENLGRFAARTRDLGTSMTLNFCLMQQNWHEFGDFLRFAEERGFPAIVNTVTHPSFSPYCLPDEEFARMVDALDAQDDEVSGALSTNRGVWERELERLRSWRSRTSPTEETPVRIDTGGLTKDPTAFFVPSSVPMSLLDPASSLARLTEAQAIATAGDGMEDVHLSVLWCDSADRVTGVYTDHRGARRAEYVHGLSEAECVGRSYADVAWLAARRYGGAVRTIRDEVVAGAAVREVILGRTRNGTGDGELYARALAIPRFEAGSYAGSVTVSAWTEVRPSWASQTAGANGDDLSL